MSISGTNKYPVPDEWQTTSIGRIAKVTTGGTPSTSNPAYWNGTIPWVATGEIDFNVITCPTQYITEAGVRNSSAKPFPSGTLVMAMFGQGVTRGKVAILGIEAAFNQACSAIVPQNGDYPKYVFYWLAFHYEDIRRLGQVGTQSNLNGGIIKSIPITLPTLPEQKRIADILGTWDEVIEKTEKLIEAKKKLKKGLMQQLLTGKKRFRKFEGQQWQHRRAGDLFRSHSERNNDGEELLSVTQDQGVVPRHMLEGKVVMPNGSTGGYKLVTPGDFVISLRSFQGGLEYSEYRGLVSPAYTVLKPRMDVCPSFYKHYFKSYNFIAHLAVAVIGIRDGKQVSYDDFAFLKVPYPPLEEQENIAAVLDQCDRDTALSVTTLESLKEQKKGLMQKLLTGRIRVKA